MLMAKCTQEYINKHIFLLWKNFSVTIKKSDDIPCLLLTFNVAYNQLQSVAMFINFLLFKTIFNIQI